MIFRQVRIETNPKLIRSTSYRQKYFDTHKGILGVFYFCPYCGKLMKNKNKMEVDHIYGVRRVQVSKRLRTRFKQLNDGVNDISNLTISCKHCNRRKGRKAGVWVSMGKFGKFFMPIVRLSFFILVIFILIIHGIPNLGVVINWLRSLSEICLY